MVQTSITDVELQGEVAALGTARVVQVGAPPDRPINAPLWRNSVIALVVGTMVGLGLAFLRDNLDRTVKTPDDVTKAVGLPVLGAIPRVGGRIRKHSRDRDFARRLEAEGYDKVRSSLQFILMTDEITSIVVTSANQAEGKTTTSSHLASAMAAIGTKTIVADIDFHRPWMHQVFGLELSPGLSDHCLDGTPIPALIHQPKSDLLVLTAGTLPPNPADFLAGKQFSEVLGWLKQRSELLILDSPPALPVADTLAIAQQIDATLVTVYAGSTTRDELKATVAALTQTGARIVGVVLIGVTGDVVGARYGYYAAEPKCRGIGGSAKRLRRLGKKSRRKLLTEAPVDTDEEPDADDHAEQESEQDTDLASFMETSEDGDVDGAPPAQDDGEPPEQDETGGGNGKSPRTPLRLGSKTEAPARPS